MSTSLSTCPSPPVETGTSAALARTSLITVSAILALVFALAGSLLIYFAHELDRAEYEHAQSLIEKSVENAEKTLRLTVKDYAFWGDAYKHLHLAMDIDWAYVRENFGPTLHDDFGFQGLFVIGPDNQTRYSVIEGRLQSLSAEQWLGQPIETLVREARASADAEEVVTLLTLFHGLPTLVAAAAVTPGTDPTASADERPASVMLVTKALSPQSLQEMGADLAIEGLRVAPADTPADALVTIVGDRGAVFRFTWDRHKPGQEMLVFMLPLMVLAGAIVLLMAWIMLRRTTLAARSLDASHQRLRSSESALAISESRFRDVAEASSDWIWEVDGQGRVTYLSERFQTVTGLSGEQWLGASINDLIYLEHGSLLEWLGSVERPANATLECRYRDVHQQERIARIAARGTDGLGFRGTASDITDEIEARRRVDYLAGHDVLTGLANRVQLREFLDTHLSLGQTPCPPVAMLTIDLDRFKPVNDLLGHATGDKVLHHAASRISQCVRQGDMVARVGGDEFVMVLCGMAAHAEVEAVCRRLIESIERVIVINGQDIHISASIGIAMAPTDASHVTELLRYSEIALYAAKAGGRGTWRFYAGDMNERIIEQRRLETDLRHAIKHDELRLQFQPRFRLADGHMVGAEALVRWQHPQRGLIGPDAFIPIAEETGLITALGDWVLNAACTQARGWPAGLFVSVNVSSKEFQAGQMVARVEAALAQSGLGADRLELELTESVMVEDADNALELMRSLKALGVRLAMDDFGTGYSSLSYLRTFPFDGLKIDRSFVARLGDSPADLAVIEAVIGLGRALSLTVTAEGIETPAQRDLLHSVACAEGQGYGLSRPLDIVAFQALLAERLSDEAPRPGV